MWRRTSVYRTLSEWGKASILAVEEGTCNSLPLTSSHFRQHSSPPSIDYLLPTANSILDSYLLEHRFQHSPLTRRFPGNYRFSLRSLLSTIIPTDDEAAPKFYSLHQYQYHVVVRHLLRNCPLHNTHWNGVWFAWARSEVDLHRDGDTEGLWRYWFKCATTLYARRLCRKREAIQSGSCHLSWVEKKPGRIDLISFRLFRKTQRSDRRPHDEDQSCLERLALRAYWQPTSATCLVKGDPVWSSQIVSSRMWEIRGGGPPGSSTSWPGWAWLRWSSYGSNEKWLAYERRCHNCAREVPAIDYRQTQWVDHAFWGTGTCKGNAVLTWI